MPNGGVPVEGTPTLKLVKGVFDTRRCTMIMTYLVLGMCAIYIILMGLPYWVGLVEWIALRGVLPSS